MLRFDEILRPAKQSTPEPNESLPHSPSESLISHVDSNANLAMSQLSLHSGTGKVDSFLELTRSDDRFGEDYWSESRFDSVIRVDGTGSVESSTFRFELDEGGELLAE